MEKNKKRISFIIPTYNRASSLIESLSCLEKQIDTNKDEVVIVDDGSKLEDKKRIKIFMGSKKFYKYLYKNNEGPAKARNIAIKESIGEILIFLNDDSIINDNYVNEQVNFHKSSVLNFALIGRFDEKPDLIKTEIMNWLVWESNLHFRNLKDKKVVPWFYFWTGNLSIKKKFLIRNDLWFDEDFKVAAWEDVEFGYRAKKAGLKIYFRDEVNAYHNHYFRYKDIMSRFF